MSGAPYPAFRGTEPCLTGDPDRFFPERGTRAGRVKAECQPCPLRESCLAWALSHGEPGIWGGTTDQERMRMRRQLGIRAVPAQPVDLDREQVLRMAGRNTPNHVIAEVLGVQTIWIGRILGEHRRKREAAA